MTTSVSVLRAAVAEGEPTRVPWLRRLAGRRALALGLVAAADALLWGPALGWSAALLVWLALAALAVSGGARPRAGGVRALYGAAALQAASLGVDPTPLPLVMSLLALAAVALADRQGLTPSVGAWLRRLASFLPVVVAQPFEDWAHAAQHHRRLGRRPLSWTSPTRWALPLALGALFVGLFTVANPLLDHWITDGFASLGRWLRHVEGLRVAAWAGVGVVAWGLLRSRTGAGRPASRLAPPSAAAWVLAPATLLRCLVVLNLVFLLENGLDVSYLWLGRALPDGLTYAAYAQRGAYPLLAAALLAAAFVLATFRAGVDPQALRGPRRLVLLLLAQNVLLTAAALRRLALYVDAYSLTRWRVAAGLWMLLVALGLLLVAVRILRRRTNAWLVRRSALATLLVLLGVSWTPLDGWIADFNVARCAEIAGPGHAPIDLGYLRSLDTGALAALDRLSVEAPEPALRREARALARAERAGLRERLADWRSWTLRRARAASRPVPPVR